jgi:hypothetical protein
MKKYNLFDSGVNLHMEESPPLVIIITPTDKSIKSVKAFVKILAVLKIFPTTGFQVGGKFIFLGQMDSNYSADLAYIWCLVLRSSQL